jgi:hypothetical protein
LHLMAILTRAEIRQKLLASLDEFGMPGPGRSLPHVGALVRRVVPEGTYPDNDTDREVLEAISELFRTGILGWGATTSRIEGGTGPGSAPPFFHVTKRGLQVAAQPSRDPSDPDGYLEGLRTTSPLDPVTESYIAEALHTYSAGCFKSAAVMVGAAAERLILNLRDAVAARITTLGKTPPKLLMDWRIKTVRDELTNIFGQPAQQAAMSKDMRPRYEMYWPSLSESLRQSRNAAGHPVEIDPISPELAHGNLLVFPIFASVVAELTAWSQAHNF